MELVNAAVVLLLPVCVAKKKKKKKPFVGFIRNLRHCEFRCSLGIHIPRKELGAVPQNGQQSGDVVNMSDDYVSTISTHR